MNITREDQALLETNFSAEIEKEAADQVAVLSELYDVGFTKMAAAAAESMDEAEEEEKEEEAKKPEKKLNEGQKKEAAARGAFLARYYVDGLMKQGSERHNDELYYLYPSIDLALDKLAAGTEAQWAQAAANQGATKTPENAKKSIVEKLKGAATATGTALKAPFTKEYYEAGKKHLGEAAGHFKGVAGEAAKGKAFAERATAAGKGLLSGAKGVARYGTIPAAVAALGGAAYGAKKMHDRSKAKEQGQQGQQER